MLNVQIILPYFYGQYRIDREPGPQPSSLSVPARFSVLTLMTLSPWYMPINSSTIALLQVFFFLLFLAFLSTLRPSQTEQLAFSPHVKYLTGLAQAQFGRNILVPFKMTFP